MSMKPFIFKTIRSPNLFITIIDIFYLSGELISLHLLRRDLFAVYKYSLIGHSLQLQQSQLVDNPGKPQYILDVRLCQIPSKSVSGRLNLQGRCGYFCKSRLYNI